ncbi:uncharacterized protein LOC122009925 [Zingiber officinale]|nr:uncharacterized protein LOC122009925 [Zingiber officinale]XP_042422175.1 uncharacterized protein LOC122009925 [Zingiber officinale]XP_042422176.1 uncharacterized protein LOC122009925 [Zingiber officinale]XP_042422177.1 uncharacterized protein LOC122009925 [Zingiber officinale]
MSEIIEIQRVSCVRDFPKGCGPNAVVVNRKTKEALTRKPDRVPPQELVEPQPLPTSSPPGATESEEVIRDFPKGSVPKDVLVIQTTQTQEVLPQQTICSPSPPSAGEFQEPTASTMGVAAAKLAENGVVVAIRDFPKGCVPSSVVGQKTEADLLQPVIPPSSPLAMESKELTPQPPLSPPLPSAAESKELTEPPAGVTADVPLDRVVENSLVGCLEHPVVDPSVVETGNVAADDEVNRGDALDQFKVVSDNQDEKLGTPQLLENQLEQPKPSDVSTTDGSSHDDVNAKSHHFLKLIPPLWKRTVPSIRDYPIGCGVGASPLTREQAIKLTEATPTKGNSSIDEKHPTVKQQPTALKNLGNDNVTEAVRPEAKFSKSAPPPSRKPLEAKDKLARAASDKRLQPFSSSSENQRSKIPGSDDKKFPSGKFTGKLIERNHIINDVKGNSSKKTTMEGHVGIQKLDADDSRAYGERPIILVLMAASNCPWRKGHKSSFQGSFRAATPMSKVKREKTALGIQFAKRQRPASEMQLALPQPKRQRLTSNFQLTLPELEKEQMPLELQEAFKDVEDDDCGTQHDENEGALVVYKESSELSSVEGSKELTVTLYPVDPFIRNKSGNSMPDVVARNKVKNILRHFQSLCRKLLQTEESKSKESSKIKRVDLTAAQIIKKNIGWVNSGKPIIGTVPGVEVGDEFRYRVELAIVGLHRPFQGGIDATKKAGISVATSIVASGGYNDDMDSSDVLIYSGSGGNPAGPDKPREDQRLERGNLALKNSIDTMTPVRVIHGSKEMKPGSSHDTKPKLVSTFTYAGLYLVERYWLEDPDRYSVFKFQLRRMSGQPELAFQEVKRSKKLKVRAGLCVKDISNGKEKIPICAINTINDEHPPPFMYITKNKYPSWFSKTPPTGCNCYGGCSDSENCVCAVRNGGEIPFNHDGAIVEAKSLIYECGPSCKCLPSCYNRVSQRGIQIPLEIFRTETRGWGVRSLSSITSGSFICEYVGELLQDKEAEKRINDEYLFDIGHNYDHSLPEGFSSTMTGSSRLEMLDNVNFTIDAAEYGNVGRFINHSCTPNLYAQNVVYDHDNERIPHVMLFAMENIPPLQELTYHYNYTIGQVQDSEGNVRKKECFCGTPECTGRLY